MESFNHITVLERRLVDCMAIKPNDIAIDCTAGGGGHTALMLEAAEPSGRILAIDRDPHAINAIKSRFGHFISQGRLIACHGKFSSINEFASNSHVTGKVQGICADLGFSSPQVDNSERGFAFSHDGPLDMRMDPSSGCPTAESIVNEADEADLSRIFRDLGEEPKAKAMARAIVKARSSKAIVTTKQLADLASRVLVYGTKSKTHPATRIFQALRIKVNNELGELEDLLDKAMSLLQPGGRLAIISFHSLEDRLVKSRFREWSGLGPDLLPRDIPLTNLEIDSMRQTCGSIIKPFPYIPDEEECRANPRARSAKLRVIEKLTQ